MAGLENITSKILEEAEAESSKIIADANQWAQSKEDEMTTAAENECVKIAQKAEVEGKNVYEKIISEAHHAGKVKLLEAKVSKIKEAIDKALENLQSVDGNEYVQVLTHLCVCHSHTKASGGKKDADNVAGEIILNKNDKAQYGADLQSSVDAALKSATLKTGKEYIPLVVSEQTADIKKGLILSYGGVEENCSFEALLNMNKESVEDGVSKALFN